MAQTDTLTYLIRFKVDATDTTKLKQIETALKGVGVAPKIAQQGVTSLGDAIWKLGSRAALTIPIWLALRGAMLSVFGSIGSATESMLKLDEALHNTANELQGMQGLDTFMVGLRESAIKLSTETGTAVEKVVETFRRFATAGIDASTSLAGMNTAVKGSIATMDDSVEVARFLADVYNQMGNKITEVSGAQEKFNYIMSTVATLMPSNTFTMKEFMDAFANFGGTAKAANLTLDQTFALIASSATAMQRGARGGTQLASAFSQLSKKSEEISSFLGKDSLEGMSQFEIFLSVLEKASATINAPGAGSNSILRQIEGMFGNRGGRDVKALSANLKQFVGELERLSKLSPNDRNAILIERYGTAIQKMTLQIDRMKQLRDQLIRTFIEGLTGTNDFGKALEKINEQLAKMEPLARGAGDALRTFLQVAAVIGAGAVGGKIIGGVGGALTAAGGFAALSKTGALRAGLGVGAANAFGLGGFAAALSTQIKVGVTGAFAALGAKFPWLARVVASPLGVIGAAAGAGAMANQIWTNQTLDANKQRTESDAEAQKQFLILNDIKRRKAGLTPLRPDLIPPGSKLPGAGEESTAPASIDEANLTYLLEQKVRLNQELTKLGYNEVEIARLNYDLAAKKAKADGDSVALAQANVDLMIALNKESKEFSDNLQSAFKGGLSDVLMGEGTLEDLGLNIGNSIRKGLADALAGNVTDQIFKATNMGGMFGDIFANIRHSNDKIGGPIKSAFDYGGKQSYDFIVKGFRDGMAGGGGVATLTSTGGGGQFGNLTLPGFGPTGIFNTPIGGFKRGTSTATGSKYGTSTYTPATQGATWGQAAGVGAGSLLTGYSMYQSAGGANGSLAIGSGVMGGIGSLAMGASMLGFGATAAAGTLAATIAPLLGPIGLVLVAGAMIMSAFSKSKSSSVDERDTSTQVASKIDVTNTKLDLVNRNLIALRGTMETYILPESAYFSEKRLLLEDQFSIDRRRG